jgi:hypothetical protein
VSAAVEEARAEHVVGATFGDGLEEAGEVRGVVLAVAVEVDGRRVALVARQLEPGAQGGAEAPRALVRDDPRAVLAADGGGGVARAVID